MPNFIVVRNGERKVRIDPRRQRTRSASALADADLFLRRRRGTPSFPLEDDRSLFRPAGSMLEKTERIERLTLIAKQSPLTGAEVASPPGGPPM
jgi:hypothetical protein